MSEIAIHVEGLSKRYRLGQRERYRALRGDLTRAATVPCEIVVVIGRNKTGKDYDGSRTI
jgi:hypothetical protein